MIEAGDLQQGNIIKMDDTYYRVESADHIKKSRGQAFIQTELKNLDEGGTVENRFRSDEKVNRVHTQETPMQFTYEDRGRYHFMDIETAEEVVFDESEIESKVDYLQPNTEVRVLEFEGNAVDVKLPRTVEMKVVDTPPQLQGATATDEYKPATLESGLETKVPSFVEEGETVSIDTSDGSYVERVE